MNKLRHMRPQRVFTPYLQAAKLFHLISVRVHNYWDIFMTTHERTLNSAKVLFQIPNTWKYNISSHYEAINVSCIKFTCLKVCIMTPNSSSHDALPPFCIGFPQNVTWQKSPWFWRFCTLLAQALPGLSPNESPFWKSSRRRPLTISTWAYQSTSTSVLRNLELPSLVVFKQIATITFSTL